MTKKTASDKKKADELEAMMDQLQRYLEIPTGAFDGKKRSEVVRELFLRFTSAHHMCATMLGYTESLCRIIGMHHRHLAKSRNDGLVQGMRIVVTSGRVSLKNSAKRLAPLLDELNRLEALKNAKPKAEVAQAEGEGGKATADRGVPDHASGEGVDS